MEKFKVRKIIECDLIIFGAKGDLARRKLLPALYNLEKIGLIHSKTRIIGVGRANWSPEKYKKFVRESLETFSKKILSEKVWKIFSSHLDFCNFDINDTEHFNVLLKKLNYNVSVIISYFATPPDMFGAICQGLAKIGLNNTKNRIVMEKPIGIDLISSKIINNQVSKYFPESQIYRIDHYLGKESILNILSFRSVNSLFSFNWDNKVIDHVQITIAEEIGIEGRWKYFDKIGQTRDMVQSHLLQILSMIAMSLPSDLSNEKIREEKIKILNSLKKIDNKNVKNIAVCGQYDSGYIHGKKVPGYLEELGATKNSCTETFVAIRADIDHNKWCGVPFYLRTGKRLKTKQSEIVIFFKEPIIQLFYKNYEQLPQNKLTIRLYPNEGIDIQILNKVPGLYPECHFKKTNLSLNFSDIFLQENSIDAHELLFLEIMQGIQTLFICRDEVEASWEWVDSIMNSWKEINYVPQKYQSGTWGPISSLEMITKDGRSWNEGYID